MLYRPDALVTSVRPQNCPADFSTSHPAKDESKVAEKNGLSHRGNVLTIETPGGGGFGAAPAGE